MVHYPKAVHHILPSAHDSAARLGEPRTRQRCWPLDGSAPALRRASAHEGQGGPADGMQRVATAARSPPLPSLWTPGRRQHARHAPPGCPRPPGARPAAAHLEARGRGDAHAGVGAAQRHHRGPDLQVVVLAAAAAARRLRRGRTSGVLPQGVPAARGAGASAAPGATAAKEPVQSVRRPVLMHSGERGRARPPRMRCRPACLRCRVGFGAPRHPRDARS